MADITYNNYSNIFSGLGPTPTIAKDIAYINYNSRWGVIDELTLNGQLTGKCLTFDEYHNLKDQLLQRFNKDFIPLTVIDNGNEIYRCDCAAVENIQFPDSKWVGLIPYSIRLRCYPRESFSGVYGILDPSENISFEQAENGVVSISHITSAKGFNTDSNTNAFTNAKDFVRQRTGWRTALSPYFVDYISGVSPVLISLTENIDRLNGIYSVEENYTSDQTTNSAGLLRYSIEHNSGIQGPATVAINGQLQGGLNYQLVSAIRNRFAATDFYGLAKNSYATQYSLSATGLNSTPITKSISENSLNNTIDFTFVYDNDPTSVVFAEYTVSFEEDEVTFNVNSSIQGTVKARGDKATRWALVQSHYKDNIKDNLFRFVSDLYNLESFKYTLNPDVISKSETYNELDAIINFSASYGTAPIPNSKFEYFNYTVAITPAINMYHEDPLLRLREYYVQNLDYRRRARLNIQGECKIKNDEDIDDAITTLRSQINILISRYGIGSFKALENQTITYGNISMDRVVSFQVEVSLEGLNY